MNTVPQTPNSDLVQPGLGKVQRAMLGVFLVAFIAVLIAIGWQVGRPALTEEELDQVVITTLQREAPASFLVAGTLDITATITTRSTKIFLPYLLNFDMGTTEVVLRAPGRVAYGFDVRTLDASHIRLAEDGIVEVDLPGLTVFSVEPDLESLEMKTEVGWARTHRRSGQRQEQRALAAVEDALREQAEAYLQDSAQPRINTAEALKAMLRPSLQAAGVEDPLFRFSFGSGIVMEAR